MNDLFDSPQYSHTHPTAIAPLIGNGALTMSSREIAGLVESRHADVCRAIERLIEKGVIGGCTPKPYTHEQNGQQYSEYQLDKRSSLIVVAQLCPEFTARIVDRWQELETQTKPQAFDPSTLSRMDILKLAMESEQARIKAEAERDEAIRTKAQIGSKREATAMATAAKAKAEAAKAKAELGFCEHHATIKAVATVTGETYDWLPLRRWCKAHDIPPKKVVDQLYGKVQAWPAGAWWDCHRIDLSALFGRWETV